jgi:tripartite-type tricarboxylate transporter receptor subunit TctC
MRKTFRSAIAAAMVWLAFGASAPAQDYPTRTIKLIIPLGPGGGGDAFTRALADELQRAWGQPVVVENRPGGGQNVGARACAEAPPDGYTLCVLSSEPAVYNQFLFKTIPYDPEKDFAPIAILFINTLAMVANNSLNVKTLDDVVALAKARPGTLSYGTFSFPLSKFMEKLTKETGTDIVRVPFKGGGEVVNAVLSGSTPLGLLALSNMIGQLKGNLITGVVVFSDNRMPLFPDVATLKEVRNEHYPSTWFGLFAPSRTPRPVQAKIAAEVARIVDDPAFRQRMYFERGVEPAELRLDAFAKFVRDERLAAEKLVQEWGRPGEE